MGENRAALTQGPPHRLALAALAVVVPLLVGGMATLVQWPGRVVPSVETDALPSAGVVTATAAPVQATLLRDGSSLIPWPLTSAPIHLAPGDDLEIVLYQLPGESVQSLDHAVLAPMRPPACHLAEVCGLGNVSRWAFHARSRGFSRIQIDYGLRCRPLLCGNAPTSILVTVTTPSGPH